MKSLQETLNKNLNEGGLVFGDLEDFISEMADRIDTKNDVTLFFDAISDGVVEVLATMETLRDMAKQDGDDELAKQRTEIFKEFEWSAKKHKLL